MDAKKQKTLREEGEEIGAFGEREMESERERASDQVLIICRDEKKVERKKFEA